MRVKCYDCKRDFSSGECVTVRHRSHGGYWLCHPCHEEFVKKRKEQERIQQEKWEKESKIQQEKWEKESREFRKRFKNLGKKSMWEKIVSFFSFLIIFFWVIILLLGILSSVK